MATDKYVYKVELDTKDAERRLKVIQGGLEDIEKTVNKGFKRANKSIKKMGDDGSRSVNKLSKSVSRLDTFLASARNRTKQIGRNLSSLGKKMTTGLTLPIGVAGAAAIKLASDFEESTNKVDVSFGDSSQVVKDFAKTTLKNFGIAEGSALEMSALFGDMGTAMGLNTDEAAQMSTRLTGLAGDLASFKNIKIDVAQTALSAIFTGETESLKKLGIVMTQENLKLFAREQGYKKSFKNMTQAEKTTLRYNFVLAQTSKAHGDFERTGAGAANQTRQFTQGLKQIGERLGKIVLPLFTKLVNLLNQALDWFASLSPETQQWVVIIAGLAAALGPVVFFVGQLIAGVSAIVALPFAAWIGTIVVGLGFLASGIKTVYENWEFLKVTATEAIDAIWEKLRAVADWMMGNKYIMAVVDGLSNFGGAIAGSFAGIGEAASNIFNGRAFEPGFAMEQMAAQGAGGNSVSVGDTSVTINAANADARQVHKIVNKEMNKRDRKQIAAIKSAASATGSPQI